MRFAARINSFRKKYSSIGEIITAMSRIDGLTDVEINLPEHIENSKHMDLARRVSDVGMDFAGAAVRYRDDFLSGEFGHRKNRAAAIDLARQSIDVVSEMGGDTVTFWLAYDGYDYSFQIDYTSYWTDIISAFQTIADHNKDMRISIEFKPWEPRIYSIMPNSGTTLHALNCIDRGNVGMTLDYCHSLMAGENPSMSLALAGLQKKLFGIHLNDGNGFADDGHIFGSENIVKSLEFLYYLNQHNYNDLIYFDTFPIYEDPDVEVALNIQLFKTFQKKLEQIGYDKIAADLQSQKKMSGQRFVLDNIL